MNEPVYLLSDLKKTKNKTKKKKERKNEKKFEKGKEREANRNKDGEIKTGGNYKERFEKKG